MDRDAEHFACRMAQLNKSYSDAYVMDICRMDDGLKIIETNCINAAGFYAADLMRLAIAIEDLS